MPSQIALISQLLVALSRHPDDVFYNVSWYLQQVVYGADKQSWAKIRGALRKGEVKDGPVTLVLERRVYDN